MKLVDILARRLKSWPEQAVTAVQDLDGEVKFDHSHEMPRINKSRDVWIRQGDQSDSIHPEELAEDCSHAIVTRDQWQAAVDALKKPKAIEWEGGGLPSAGVMCEYLTLDCGEYWCKASVSYVGTHWVVVGYDHPTQGISEAGVNHVLLNGNLSSRLRPLLTPEQIAARERKEIEEDIQRVCMTGENGGTPYYKALYDAGYRKFEIIDEPKS